MNSLTSPVPSVKPAPKARKPRSKPARTLALIERPSPMFDGYGALKITEGKKVDLYLFRPFEADWGRGFQVEKLGSDLETVEQYDVNLMGEESTCTCPGNTYHGHCRHVEGLKVLDERGLLPPARAKDVTCPQCGDVSPDGVSGTCPGCQAENDHLQALDQLNAMLDAGLDPWASPEAEQRIEMPSSPEF